MTRKVQVLLLSAGQNLYKNTQISCYDNTKWQQSFILKKMSSCYRKLLKENQITEKKMFPELMRYDFHISK